MRDYIVLYINGKEHRVRGEQVFAPITDYLRYEKGDCGTKVVCAEGDCGACTALVGRSESGKIVYRALNACIQYVYQLDCTHVITIEGLKLDGQLNGVQEAMVDCHGAQCGYCTPGFIVAMCGMFDTRTKVDAACIKEELTGNLCRCTGYESIIKAGLSVDPVRLFRANELYPPAKMLKSFKEHLSEPVQIDWHPQSQSESSNSSSSSSSNSNSSSSGNSSSSSNSSNSSSNSSNSSSSSNSDIASSGARIFSQPDQRR